MGGPPPPPPPYVWTGCYIGSNVGGAWSDVSVSNNFTGVEVSRSNGGFAGGGQIGCDFQFARVIGIRNLFDGTSISHTRDIDPLFFNTAFSNPRITLGWGAVWSGSSKPSTSQGFKAMAPLNYGKVKRLQS